MPLELSIMFISLTLRSKWPYKRHMHVSFRKQKQHIKNYYAGIHGIQEAEAMTGV